jgi:hypothetical protein
MKPGRVPIGTTVRVREHHRITERRGTVGRVADRYEGDGYVAVDVRFSGGFIGVGYERFWQMPVAVVLMVLWLGGMALLSSCVLMLYTLGRLLVSVSAGA